MIKAVIFDCYGVIVEDGWLDFRKKFFGADSEKYELVSTWNRMVDAGIKSHEEFIADMANLVNKTPSEVQHLLDKHQINDELFEFISELKNKYQIGLLSNAGRDRITELVGEKNRNYFDGIVLSYQVGYTKPQPEIYEVMLDRLGLSPEECIFVDDQIDFCKGAEFVGMKAVNYKNVPELRNEVEEIIKNA